MLPLSMRITSTHNADQEQAQGIASHAAAILRDGGLVVFPTETVYGIAAWAASPRGYEALRSFKDRPPDQPFTIHLARPSDAGRYIDLSNPEVRRVVEKLLPGPVTLVVDVPEEVIEQKLEDAGLDPRARGWLYHDRTVGLRCPDMPIAQTILAAVDGPVIASSANRRGQPPPFEAAEAAEAVGDAARLVVDGGRSRYAKPSTIVRVSLVNGYPKLGVERVGVYDERVIRKLMRWTVVFVCSGNTCRSPMAAALAKHALAQARRIDPDDLEAAGVRVLSAGASTTAGMPASAEAVEVMNRVGVDLTQHRSQPLTPQVIEEADVIYCMTEAHRRAVVAMAALAADRTLLLDRAGADIDDPFGADTQTYQRCAELIRQRVHQRLVEQEWVADPG